MVGQSQFVKNGQQIKVAGGSAAIPQGALAIVGGPGVEAWPACTIDYAVQAQAGALAVPAQVASAATTGSRQSMARDRLGNVYLAGTNGSGRLVVYKYGPMGVLATSAILDATATSVNGAELFQLSNGSFCCVYARAAGAMFFVIFDAFLNLIAGPSSIATEVASTNLVRHAALSLSGGGFAVVYQTTAQTSLQLATYSNAGTTVTASTNVQTLAGSAAQSTIKAAQLSSGNLVIAYRGTMTAGGVAGTSFSIVTAIGGAVAGPTNVDVTSTAGLVELSVMVGTFAIADGNGTNLVAAVYNNAGAAQGSAYSTGNTLNNAYPQVKLTNDGVQFWLAWFSSTGNGLFVVPISVVGASGIASTGLGSSSINAGTFALDAVVVNGLLAVLALSTGTAGQFLMTVGLPDSSLGIYAPYVRAAPSAYGGAAATTGGNGPRLLSGGGGFYVGTGAPLGQGTQFPGCGDFTVIVAYDQQNVATTVFGIQKLENSSILGICQLTYAANQPGATIVLNPGEGEYPTLAIAGTYGSSFNHLAADPVGTSGALYGQGAGLSGVATGSSSSSSLVGTFGFAGYDETLIPTNAVLCDGASYATAGAMANLFAKIGYAWGGSGASFQVPDFRGLVLAGAENMGGANRGNLGGNSSTGGFSGTAALATTAGEKAHVQVTGEVGDHTHPYNSASAASTQPTQGGGAAPVLTNTGNTNNRTPGTTAAANITQPTACVNMFIYFA